MTDAEVGRGLAALLRITNLDVELFPFQSMPERVRVHPHFAAPEVVQFRVDDGGPRTDVYHLAMFAYYWLAGWLAGRPARGAVWRATITRCRSCACSRRVCRRGSSRW